MSNVKTLVTPVNVHGKICNTLIVDKKSTTVDYDLNQVTANVTLIEDSLVQNGAIVSTQGSQWVQQLGLKQRYTASVSSFEPEAVYIAIFAEVTKLTGYIYTV